MKISNRLLTKIQESIGDMFVENQQQMEEAYLIAGDDPLNIAIRVKITPDGAKQKVVTSINFIKDCCKDSITAYVDEYQGDLFAQQEKLKQA